MSVAEGLESVGSVGRFASSVYAAIETDPNAHSSTSASSGRFAPLARPAMHKSEMKCYGVGAVLS
jgi:hypothetical protein